MQKKILYFNTIIILILLTSFVEITHEYNDWSLNTTLQNQADKQLCISQTANLGMPKIMLSPDTIYTSYSLKNKLFKLIPNDFEDKAISFHLPKGFMVVFAEHKDGTGESACYVASETDIKANLPKRLQNNISYVRCIAINNPSKKGTAQIQLETVKAAKADWFYGWSLNKSSLPNQHYVPMTWGKGSCTDENIQLLIGNKDADHLLSFNEPDNKSQANILDFSVAVESYKMMQKTGLRLGSPALTQGHAFGEGKWLTQFMELAKKENARVDFIALHWYDWGNQTSNKATDEETAAAILKRFINYIEKAHATYPEKPIWITEFNANINRTSEEIHKNFMTLATEWMDDQTFIERYAYFFPKPLPETNTDNSLTELGKYWANIKSKRSFSKNIIGDAEIIKKK